MKIYRLLFAFLLIPILTNLTFATSYTWNGGTSSDWGTSTNWTPNGVPGTSDDVVIVSAGTAPVYDGIAGVTNFTMTSGTLDLNGYAISITGTAAFSSGTINNGIVNCSGSSSTFSGTLFGAKVNAVSASILLSGSRFQSTSYFKKTGSTGNQGGGNNVFQDTCTIINAGTNIFTTKNDTFYKPVYLHNLGSSFVSVSYNSQKSYFKDDVHVKSKSGQGIFFGYYVSGAENYIEENHKIIVDTFTNGFLEIHGLTHNSNSLQELITTGSSTIKIIDCDIDDSLIVQAPSVFFEENHFGDYCSFTKTSGTNNYGKGGNVFSDYVDIINNGNGELGTGSTYPDTFLMPVAIYNTGNSRINMAQLASGHYFADTVWVNSTSGSGIRFCYSCSSLDFASMSKVLIGSSGFSSGSLSFKNLNQLNTDTAYFNLTGTATFDSELSTWNGKLTVTSPYLSLTNNVFNDETFVTKTGSSTNTLQGGNIFNGSTLIVNQGGTLTSAVNYPDTFNSPVTYRLEGLGAFAIGYGTAVNYYGDDVYLYNLNPSSYPLSFQTFGANGKTVFDGDVYVNCTSIGGVYFGAGGTPTLTMTEGHTISVGDTGFTKGPLRIRLFSQEGSTPVNLTTTGSSVLDIEDSEFGGAFTFDGPGFILENDTFNGDCSFTRDTSINHTMTGSTTFYGDVQFVNHGSGTVLFPSSDTYNGNATYVATSTGMLKPSNGTTNYKGNIHLNDPAKVTLGLDYAGGKTILSGYGIQTISSDSTGTIAFRDLKMDKLDGYLTLGRSISIQDSLILNYGVIKTDTFLVDIPSSAVVYGGDDTSYVDGKLKRTGNSAFTFLIGGGGYQQNLSIAATTSSSNQFTAQFHKKEQDFSLFMDTSLIDFISTCEYWELDRSATDSIVVTLQWNLTSCAVDTPLNELLIAAYDGTEWISLGNANITGDRDKGTITAAIKIGPGFINPIRFVKGLHRAKGPIITPSYARLKKELDGAYYSVLWGKLYFKYNEQYRDGILKYRIYDKNRDLVMHGDLSKVFGDNRYLIDCHCLAPGFHTLEVVNDKNEVEKLHFKMGPVNTADCE